MQPAVNKRRRLHHPVAIAILVSHIAYALAASTWLDAAAQRVSVGPADAWDTFVADVSIAFSRVQRDGTEQLNSALRYTWRRSQTSRGWTSVLEFTAGRGPRLAPNDLELVDPSLTIARIEDDEDGSPLRAFNPNGELIALPGDVPGRLPRAPIPDRVDGRLPPVPDRADGRPHTTQGRDWIDAFFATPAKQGGRRQALEQAFGKPVGRIRGLDRFERTEGNRRYEMLVDPTSAVLVEVNVVQDSVLLSHRTIGYGVLADGTLVKHVVRSERLDPRGERRLVTSIEFSNIRLERRR